MEIGPNDRLFQKVPWITSVAEHIFSTTNASEEDAEMLSIKKDDALFVVQRLTWIQEKCWNRLPAFIIIQGRLYQM